MHPAGLLFKRSIVYSTFGHALMQPHQLNVQKDGLRAHILHALLTSKLPEDYGVHLNRWWATYCNVSAPWSSPIERAIIGGFHSSCMGFAFVSGYQAAIESLLISERIRKITKSSERIKVAFCATEDTPGANPKSIRTSLTPFGEDFILTGTKSFVTLGSYADWLLVVARNALAGHSADRNALVSLSVVLVPASQPGIEILPATRELNFIPEVPHSAVRFTNCVVPAANVLPGDGFRDFVKPFRTIEDIHVEAALVSYAFRLARQYLIDKELCARLLTLLAALLEAAREPPSDPAVHILLSGIFAESSASLSELEAELPRAGASADVMANWERDKPLRSVARRARDARLRVAWDTVRSPRSAL